MKCCGAHVTLKTSNNGLQFFSHLRTGDCSSAGESPEHLLAKKIIAIASEDAGWTAYVEYRHNDGDWIADVLVENGDRRVVFEVQLASQSIESINLRHSRYQRDGISCVWLLKGPKSMKPERVIHRPLFYLSFRGVESQPSVFQGVNDPRILLSHFVRGVLDGKINIEGRGIQYNLYKFPNDTISSRYGRTEQYQKIPPKLP
jgi:hypothetical protein